MIMADVKKDGYERVTAWRDSGLSQEECLTKMKEWDDYYHGKRLFTDDKIIHEFIEPIYSQKRTEQPEQKYMSAKDFPGASGVPPKEKKVNNSGEIKPTQLTEEDTPEEKEFWWFMMMRDWFNNKEVVKLRHMSGGIAKIIIYQKIILSSLKTRGKLYFEGIGDNLASEIALVIGENKETVAKTIDLLMEWSIISKVAGTENVYQINTIPNLIGSETKDADRKRKSRAKNKSINASPAAPSTH
jgi:predicted phage replisome organizer